MRRRAALVVSTFLIIMVAAVVIYALVPKRYTASAEVRLDHESEQRYRNDAGQAHPDTIDGHDREINRLITVGAAGAFWPSGLRSGVATSKGLSVRPSERPYVAVVSLNSPDAREAARVVNAIVARYVADRHRLGVRSHELARSWEQAEADRDGMVRAEAKAASLRAAHGATAEENLRRLREQAAALDAQLVSLNAQETRQSPDPLPPAPMSALARATLHPIGGDRRHNGQQWR